MSATWYIYSPLPPTAMTKLETAFEQYFEAYADVNGDALEDDDGVPEVVAGGSMPPAKELEALYAHLGIPLPKDILKRYKACKSVMTLDRASDLETDSSRAFVSILRYLLARTGEGALVMQNDVPLVTAEELITKLRKKKGLPGFDEESNAGAGEKRKAPAARGEKPGEVRAVRVSQALDALMNDPELALDLRQALHKTPKLGQQYAALILQDGVMPDAAAAKKLGVRVEALAEAADELDEMLGELRD
ncbi:MAG: hypothetical protein IPM54_25780 [Polyangiaceae bacterium]|nr:hypothetical protein [Polyangiaceae bacterium]